MKGTRLIALALVMLLLAGVAAALLGGRGEPREEPRDLPRAIAAIGDSITRAAAVEPGAPGDSPERSWSTGDEAYSHRSRLAAAGASLSPEDVHNVALSGARMEDAPPQARAAVEAGAEYVTFLMGANDVCASEMPSIAEFRGNFLASLNILMSRLPEAYVFVASIPDVARLWTLFESDTTVTRLWDAAGICPAFLSSRTSDAARAAAFDRLVDYNQVLEEGCGAVTRCIYDGGAVFAHRFEPADVSTVDFFHPSARGQETLAEITWRAGLWGERSP